MPVAPKSPCLHPGCRNLVSRGDKGRCPEHRKQHSKGIDQRRGTATERGYNARWGRFREMYLAEYPLCAVCGRGAQEVHHRVPVTGPDDPSFFDPSAVVGLCKPCHSAETMKMINEQRRA